ncbi:thioredoxin fold domain-containing protein [bacterium]|nr:thioredoxin fold domain-containing protein [bacterium]
MKKKILVSLLVLIAMVSVIGYTHASLINKISSYQPQQNLEAPIEIPDAGITTYIDETQIEKPKLVLFYVDWCGYCRRFMPIFGEFAQKYNEKYDFVAVNCDNPENKEWVEKYHIKGFPSLFIVDNNFNHSFATHMAAVGDKNILKEELDKYLAFRETIVKK